MLNVKAICGVVIGSALAAGFSGVADAGTWSLQGSSGHRWNADGLAGLIMQDGSICTQQTYNQDGIYYYWVVPVQLSATDTWYSGTQSAHLNACTRLVSFTESGAVYGAAECTFPYNTNSIGAVYVPTNGTLFAQSTLNTSCTDNGCDTGCINSVNVSY